MIVPMQDEFHALVVSIGVDVYGVGDGKRVRSGDEHGNVDK